LVWPFILRPLTLKEEILKELGMGDDCIEENKDSCSEKL